MSNISNKQKVTAIAAIGAATVFGMLSVSSSVQAAKYSYNCDILNVAYGLSCCDRMMGSRLIDTDGDCHKHKRIVYKRKLPRLPPVITVLKKEWVEGNGGGNGDDNKGKGPN